MLISMAIRLLGQGTTIYPGASIGTKTQDLKFRGEKTYVKIGKNCEIREFVTINSSCQENSVVSVGDNASSWPIVTLPTIALSAIG